MSLYSIPAGPDYVTPVSSMEEEPPQSWARQSSDFPLIFLTIELRLTQQKNQQLPPLFTISLYPQLFS